MVDFLADTRREHGTISGYAFGCRCGDCRTAHSSYWRAVRQAAAESKWLRDMARAEPVLRLEQDHYTVRAYVGVKLVGFAVRTLFGWHVPTRARAPEGVRLRYRDRQLRVEPFPKRVAWRSFATRAEAVAALGGAR